MNKKTTALWIAAGIATTAAAGIVYAQVTPEGPSRAQVQEQAARAFDRLDANLDGKIDAADRERQERARFDAADTDHNGSLGFTEFAALRTGPADARPDGARPEGAGHGGPRGPGRGHDRGGHGPRGDMSLFGLLPLIGSADGSVSQAEFSKAILARFDRADSNKDGIMTREEAFALRQAIRADHQAAAKPAAPPPAAKAS